MHALGKLQVLYHSMGRGHSYWKVVQGCAALKIPFSGHNLAPETHLFKPFSSSRDPLPFFEKNKTKQNKTKHALQDQFCNFD